MSRISSSSPQHRAQLIREMSRDLNRMSHSSGSSKNSQGNASIEPTVSDFDPENEALMSTRQFDTMSQRLPDLRASAQKYNRYARAERPEPDFAINTSAIGRAFPDFSSGGTSDDGSMSIEIGRGLKKGNNGTIGKLGTSREFSSNPLLSAGEDSMDFSAPMIGDYQVISTPPMKQRPVSKKKENAAHGSLRRDAQVRRASALQNEIIEPSPPLAKTTDYVSGGSRQGSGEKRRTLAAMHARVRDGDDVSQISDQRPPTIDLTARNTRFGNNKNQDNPQNEALPSKFSSTKGFMHATSHKNVDGPHKAGNQLNGTVSSIPNPGTQQSFMLPDLPNLSELVSGVFQDGTPVFSGHVKSRSSRFVSASQPHKGSARGPDHAIVGEIPIPDDENAIFISLRLLQEKVGELEKNRAEAENTIQDLHQRNQDLEVERSERRRRQRSDSALGMTDGGSDGSDGMGGGQRTSVIEKNRLESSLRSLRNQIDSSNRKVSTFETLTKNMTKERDSAVSQLGVAYFSIERLKSENDMLMKENSALKVQIQHLTTGHENETRDWTTKEQGLLRRVQRRNETVRDLKEMTKDIVTEESRLPSCNMSNREREAPEWAGANDLRLHGDAGRSSCSAGKSKNMRRVISSAEASAATGLNKASDFHAAQNGDILRRARQQEERFDQIYDAQDSDESIDGRVDEQTTSKSQAKLVGSCRMNAVKGDDSSRDLTYLSFLDTDEVAKLRRTLEEERIARKQRRASDRQTLRATRDVSNIETLNKDTQQLEPTLPRKSSMKDVSGRVNTEEKGDPRTNQEESIAEQTARTKGTGDHTRRHSESSVIGERSHHFGLSMENMTSAFIIPDITIRNPGTLSQPAPKLSPAAQEVLNECAQHNNRNCTVCKRVIEHGADHIHAGTAKATITIPKPIPISERMPEATRYEEEPTIRPSQPPGLALATVLKGLEDELSHLKMQLSQYQALYNGHDPALSKRKRKSVYKKIEALLEAIDIKADQIYALYDVLEGQKQDGREISEAEVEVTLQSIGVDLIELGLRGGAAAPEKKKEPVVRHPWDFESDDDSAEDLPWEGIDSTVETSKSDRRGNSRSRRSAA